MNSDVTLYAKSEAAQNQTCTVRVPGYCNGNTETTASAHISGVRFGHGTGQKVNDILAADCCSDCHDVIDNRQRCHFSRAEIKLLHYEA
jgi:Protein of unknown function (DUF1364)